MADTTGTATDPQSRLDALRAGGADRRDPVRFAYLEALNRRAGTQPAPVRAALFAKLHSAADELDAHLTPEAAPGVTGGPENTTPSPLADLLAYIGQHAHAQPETQQSHSVAASAPRQTKPRAPRAPELKSVAYFRNTWSKLSTEQQLTQTLAQAPENAGPMNSQHLVLRSLQVMRDVAPDYLQGFMSYVDTLIWLEHADPTKQLAGRQSGNDGEKKPKTVRRGVAKR